MPESYTADWFTLNIENWNVWLAELKGKPNLRCLEIGSYEGRSTVWLLRNILTDPASTIDCCDLFHAEDRFVANTAPWVHQVKMHYGASYWTLPGLRGEYDLAYVDGDHTAYGTLADAVMTWPLLKVGGIMIFDDYLWYPPELDPEHQGQSWTKDAAIQVIERHPAECPKYAIDGFLKAIARQYELIGSDYQVAIRKITSTPMLPRPSEPERQPWWRRLAAR